MATNLLHGQLVQEDYIDIEISSSTTFLCYSISTFPKDSNEFEFQKSSNLEEKDPIISPADDLFHNGKLLPLQLIKKPQNPASKSNLDDSFRRISGTISPSSCCISQELNPEDFFFSQSKTSNSWYKKLKASKAYLKSMFTKSSCSDDSSTVLKAKVCSFVHKKTSSFSDAVIRQHLPNNSSSSSSSYSYSSIKLNGIDIVNLDVEKSIHGAIAYCKKSQHDGCGRTS